MLSQDYQTAVQNLSVNNHGFPVLKNKELYSILKKHCVIGRANYPIDWPGVNTYTSDLEALVYNLLEIPESSFQGIFLHGFRLHTVFHHLDARYKEQFELIFYYETGCGAGPWYRLFIYK